MEKIGGLVSRARNGDAVSYTGPEYVNPMGGHKRLCLRTGNGKDDVVRYGLTSNNSASQYCGLRMRVENGVAYLGRSETVSGIKSTARTETKTSGSGGSYSWRESVATSTGQMRTSTATRTSTRSNYTTQAYVTGGVVSTAHSGGSTMVGGKVTSTTFTVNVTGTWTAASQVVQTHSESYTEQIPYWDRVATTVYNTKSSTSSHTYTYEQQETGTVTTSAKTHNFNL